ncbi:MAG: DUF262 domain-containing protein [Marinilabiliaceae bacterium]|nr:DUF262 domain-containing protein [Marinilabiliaceae bacterium]
MSEVLFDCRVTGDKNVNQELNRKVVLNGLQVASCSLSELLNTSKEKIPNTTIQGQLTIPEYQRPYVWREKQINRLLSDLMEYSNDASASKPMYYLGSVILHHDNGQLKIIDGQQRITTALLIQKIKQTSAKSGISYSSSVSISNIKHNLSYLKSVKEKDIFEFRDVDVLNNINFEEINVTLVVTDTEDLAYTFFETQNTGGVRLSGSDILKAHHLRAIESRKVVNYQARKWESAESDNVENIIQQLTKIRFWDNRKWRQFPFYRDKRGIKEVIIDEYTKKTNGNKEDVSYYYSAVKNEGGRLMQMHESSYKQLKQPLTNGNNTLDYINDYIELHDTLFKNENDHRIEDAFYEFRDKVLHGRDGTVFLKELMEISIIAYVSRFGFYRLFEASLWLYRAIYSLRVSNVRNVREDSVFKFVYDNQFVDNILEVFTPDELFLFLKKFHYNFDVANADKNKAKGKHIKTLRAYFSGIKSIDSYKGNPKKYDKQLMIAITDKINKNGK